MKIPTRRMGESIRHCLETDIKEGWYLTPYSADSIGYMLHTWHGISLHKQVSL